MNLLHNRRLTNTKAALKGSTSFCKAKEHNVFNTLFNTMNRNERARNSCADFFLLSKRS